MPRTAVVIGASTAGMAAAAAVAPFFDEVVLLDGRECFADRRGVPQTRHLHFLLDGGCDALEMLLPGFKDALVARGARVVDFQRDVSYCIDGRWMPRSASGRATFMQRRVCVDGAALERLRATYTNVRVKWGARVVAWEVDAPRKRVRTADGRAFDGDLLVDASGRGSAFARAAMTAERATEIGMVYRSLDLVVPDDAPASVGVMPTADRPRGAGFMRTDGGTATAVLFGYGHGAPREVATAEQWLAAARALDPDGPLGLALARAKPAAATPHTFVYDRMYRREFATLPPGVLVLGDAACSLDPLLGQGMTKAALEAARVRAAFEAKGGCAQADIAGAAAFPHLVASIEASRHAHTRGYAPRGAGLLRRLADAAARLAASNSFVYAGLLDLLHMRRAPLAVAARLAAMPATALALAGAAGAWLWPRLWART